MKKILWYSGLVLAIAGIGLTLFLTWAHFNGSIGNVCAEGSGCQSVLNSEWATVAGLPTALYGFIFYGFLFTGILVYPLTHRQGQSFVLNGLLVTSTAGFLVSFLLMGYALTTLNSLCLYCGISFGLVTLLFLGLLFWRIRGGRQEEFTVESVTKWQGVAAGIFVMFVISLGLTFHFYSQPAPSSSLEDDKREKQFLTYGERAIGSPDAPVRVVEFFDLECPACQQFTSQVFPQIKQEFIDSGQVLWTFRAFPIPQHHEHALEAHTALSMVAPNQFLEAKKQIMTNPNQWVSSRVDDPTPFLKQVLADHGIQDVEFPREMGNHLIDRRNTYNRWGINRTPSFLVNGRIVSGGRPFSFWQQYLNQLIEEAD